MKVMLEHLEILNFQYRRERLQIMLIMKNIGYVRKDFMEGAARAF